MAVPDNAFRRRIKHGPLLCDGAVGTLLYARGVPFDCCFDALNLTQPEIVLNVHLDYLRAGAEMIETNTFGANPIKLAARSLAPRVRDINRDGATLARKARDHADPRALVAGSMGPLGKPLSPFGRITASEARGAFRAQAEALAEGGVDVLILETFADLTEIIEAVRAARDVCDLPVIAQTTFTEEGQTRFGHTPAEAVAALEEAGVDVIGTNCSVGPIPMLDIVRQMADVAHTPLSAQPNAGFPALVGGRYVYPSSPEHLAAYAGRMVSAGATIIGGCCGTTPEHTLAMARAIAGARAGAE